MPNKGFNDLASDLQVSLCMIVKNEAAHLSNCLRSVQGFVDEIIVVDTGSSDRTVNIAKKFGAKVSEFAWIDDFAAARNYALAQAQGQWILVLDGDEVLERPIIPILKDVIANPDYGAVNLNRAEPRRSPYSLITRLFRRRPDIYFAGFYHESVDDSVAALVADGVVKVITVPQVAIRHFGYRPDLLPQKLEFARRLMEKQLESYPTDVYTLNKLGALYVESGEVERGLGLLQDGWNLLKAGGLGNTPLEFELNYHLAIAFSHQQNWELAKTHYQAAIALEVADLIKIPAYNNLGNLWQSLGNYAEAIACYEKLLETAPDFATAHYNLGVARKAVYDFSGVIAAYLEALKVNPSYAEAYQNLGVALEQMGKLEASRIALSEAIKYHRQQNRPETAQKLEDYLNTGS